MSAQRANDSLLKQTSFSNGGLLSSVNDPFMSMSLKETNVPQTKSTKMYTNKIVPVFGKKSKNTQKKDKMNTRRKKFIPPPSISKIAAQELEKHQEVTCNGNFKNDLTSNFEYIFENQENFNRPLPQAVQYEDLNSEQRVYEDKRIKNSNDYLGMGGILLNSFNVLNDEDFLSQQSNCSDNNRKDKKLSQSETSFCTMTSTAKTYRVLNSAAEEPTYCLINVIPETNDSKNSMIEVFQTWNGFEISNDRGQPMSAGTGDIGPHRFYFEFIKYKDVAADEIITSDEVDTKRKILKMYQRENENFIRVATK